MDCCATESWIGDRTSPPSARNESPADVTSSCGERAGEQSESPSIGPKSLAGEGCLTNDVSCLRKYTTLGSDVRSVNEVARVQSH